MLSRSVVVLLTAVSAGLLLGCGDSEPKTESNHAEPKTIEQAGAAKEEAKSPKGSTAKAKRPTATLKPKPPEPPWRLTLPGGAELDAFLRSEGDNRFFPGRAGRFSGLYELRGDRLVMEQPLDRFETGFQWEARGPDEYALVVQRPDIGNDYLGAILKRVKDDQVKKPSNP